MAKAIDLMQLKSKAKLTDRYPKQLKRLQLKGLSTDSIEEAVQEAVKNLAAEKTSLVIYGEPQSGKTEMMIALTAKLLDEGHTTIVHLLNDSVDLLAQNLRRFKASGLAPAPRSLSELLQSSETEKPQKLIVFCKKNQRDLIKLTGKLGNKKILVIDDEADYATPNANINKGRKTPINDLVGKLIGSKGYYIGVTATPARLDLNNTFQNETEKWVKFAPHPEYTGQNVFFPVDNKITYRQTLLKEVGSPKQASDALVRFLVTVAYLNSRKDVPEENYTMLVHTSGRKKDHEADRVTIEGSVQTLSDPESDKFSELVTEIYKASEKLYPQVDPNILTEYVVETASRATLVVLNSKRDRKAAGENPTEPTSPFTVIIGGNIVSRGVTFPNLLSMFFTRGVKHKLQQDTYIQRARMFGTRNKYLSHIELTIPAKLYSDWHRCFLFHKLALASISNNLGSPVWIGDKRISIAASSSIDKSTVSLDKGEMGFGIFKYTKKLDEIVLRNQLSVQTLRDLRQEIGNGALPTFLIDLIDDTMKSSMAPGSLAIHTATSITGYGSSADQKTIRRAKGFMGQSQLEPKKFPNAVHHVKMFYNKKGQARVYYKCKGIQLVQNLKDAQ